MAYDRPAPFRPPPHSAEHSHRDVAGDRRGRPRNALLRLARTERQSLILLGVAVFAAGASFPYPEVAQRVRFVTAVVARASVSLMPCDAGPIPSPRPDRVMASFGSASMLRAPSTSSAVGLVLANLVPLVGVVWFDWSLFGVMWIYWAENGVIGAFALLRILSAGEDGWGMALLRLPLAAFFTVHYGMFWFVHGVFVYSLFGGEKPYLLDGASWTEALQGVPIEGLVPLVFSHGASFVMNYLLGGERLVTSGTAEMGKPYGRVIVLHVVILAGGFLILALGASVLVLVLFIVLKTGLDLGIHLKGHRMRQARLDGAKEHAPEPVAA